MNDDDGSPDPAGQPGAEHEGLTRRKSPSAAVKGRVQGEDGDAVLFRQVVQVGILIGIPALLGCLLRSPAKEAREHRQARVRLSKATWGNIIANRCRGQVAPYSCYRRLGIEDSIYN